MIEPEPEVDLVHDDTLARMMFEAITETRAPAATVDWEHLSAGEHDFYREAAQRFGAAGGLGLVPLADGAMEDEDEPTEGMNVINMRRALQVDAISVGILRGEGGAPALVGHFGGHPRGEPDRSVGVAWSMHPAALGGLLRQVIGAWAAVDLEMAGRLATIVVTEMEQAIAKRPPGLVAAALRPRNLREN